MLGGSTALDTLTLIVCRFETAYRKIESWCTSVYICGKHTRNHLAMLPVNVLVIINYCDSCGSV